ncbi:hypothetical protein CA264_16865 [Pontibacter actiniarum]|uniref:Uncharacterized protein n=1 Tax=Pontibacter actiniarum TaxID=323450 RepID=A0A1X9YY73_9BACT|nr:hypothetical protein CA264_16865 [Pontibacter actiniarum]
MKLLRNITLDKYNFYADGGTRKIFSVGYEDLTTLIFYQDMNNKFKLVVAKEKDPPLIIEKSITRAEAFRLMNTRP